MDELEAIAAKIREAGKGRDYDCLLGLSGGADSSYMAYIAKEVMHLRRSLSWSIQVELKRSCREHRKDSQRLDLDMYTEVVNWKEMSDFQLAMFKSQISSQDAPQDHAIFASLYNYAAKHRIKYILTGSNNSTEFIRPPLEWIYMNDLTLYKDIHRKFGKRELKTYDVRDF